MKETSCVKEIQHSRTKRLVSSTLAQSLSKCQNIHIRSTHSSFHVETSAPDDEISWGVSLEDLNEVVITFDHIHMNGYSSKLNTTHNSNHTGFA